MKRRLLQEPHGVASQQTAFFLTVNMFLIADISIPSSDSGHNQQTRNPIAMFVGGKCV
jgi:hypothetical protein